jgi:hypothetical protein
MVRRPRPMRSRTCSRRSASLRRYRCVVRKVLAVAVLTMVVVLSPSAALAAGKPSPAACKAERKVMQVAELALYASSGSHGSMDDLLRERMLKRAARYYKVQVRTDGSDFAIVPKKSSGC